MVAFNIRGIQAEAKKNMTTFSTLKPAGAVRLVPETDNAFDPFCISVWYGDTRLGYVPANKGAHGEYIGSDLQKRILKDGIVTAMIARFAYLDGDTFNEEFRGVLGSVTLDLDIPDNESGRIIGGKYQRVTDFISYFAPYGKSDGLIKWAFEQGTTYEEYQKALELTSVNGTALHAAIEADQRGEPAEWPTEALKAAWFRFKDKYHPDPCYMEKRFFDNTLMVTGQPDFVGYSDGILSVLDWKSSKKPSLKHKLQLAIYAKNAQWDGEKPKQAMVVCFGAENKQGFSTSVIKADEIERIYEGMKRLRETMDLCGCFVNNYWEGDE